MDVVQPRSVICFSFKCSQWLKQQSEGLVSPRVFLFTQYFLIVFTVQSQCFISADFSIWTYKGGGDPKNIQKLSRLFWEVVIFSVSEVSKF